MELYHLKTFVTVAHEGGITRAAERLHLSQPAISAHIKAMEETLGLELFQRTARGMRLTHAGELLLAKAEAILATQRDLLKEAAWLKSQVIGKLQLGAGTATDSETIGPVLTALTKQYPEVVFEIRHGTSNEIKQAILDGALDAGFYNESEAPNSNLTVVEFSRFSIYLAAHVGMVDAVKPLDWNALAQLPWICPPADTCCGRAAAGLFKRHQIQPKRIIHIDRENLTQELIANGTGLGLIHADAGRPPKGKIELVCEIKKPVRLLFAYLTENAQHPLLQSRHAGIRKHRKA